jgi:Putative zinc-finger
MNLAHFFYRDRLGLLAAGVLDAAEADRVSGHVADCEPCRLELDALRRTTEALRADADAPRSLPISSEALRTRVFARIHASPHSSPAAPGFGFVTAFSAAALVGVGLLAGILTTRMMTPKAAEVPATALASLADTAANDAAFYERLENTQVRANAARYLADAQDILVQVRAAADCPESPQDNVDVTREAQTSRKLLSRRAALVSGSGETLLAARGVLEEVEGLLQQVAELPQCTRRTDVDAIARRVDSKNLLMKIDLVAQELEAP